MTGPFRPPRVPRPRPPWPDEGPAPDPAEVEGLLARAAELRPPTPATADRGRVLVALARPDGSELIVAAKVFQSADGPRPYIDVRVWRGGWPEKGRGLTVRRAELVAVAKALLQAAQEQSG